MFKKLVWYTTMIVVISSLSNDAKCTEDLREKYSEMLKQSKLLPYLQPHELDEFLKNYDKAPPLHYDAVNDMYYFNESERPSKKPSTK